MGVRFTYCAYHDKRGYTSYRAAANAAQQMLREVAARPEAGEHAKPFWCPYQGRWHVSSLLPGEYERRQAAGQDGAKQNSIRDRDSRMERIRKQAERTQRGRRRRSPRNRRLPPGL